MSDKKLYEILDEYGLGYHLEKAFYHFGMLSKNEVHLSWLNLDQLKEALPSQQAIAYQTP